jgi:hypothetical protein
LSGAHEVVLRIDLRELKMKPETAKNRATVLCALLTVSTFLPGLKPAGTVEDVKLTFTGSG